MSFVDVRRPVYLGEVTARAANVQKGIVFLTGVSARAREVAKKAVDQSTLLSRSTTVEWANGFVAAVDGMVARLLTVGRDGIYPWEKNPKLLKDVGDYVAQEAEEYPAMQRELLGIKEGLFQAAEAFAETAAEGTGRMLEKATEKLQDSETSIYVVAGAGLVGLVLLGYVWRSFR